MTDHNLFYYPYASFTDAQLPLLKVPALWFDKLVILDPVGASWDTIGADHIARDAVLQLKDAGILEIVTPAAVLAKYKRPIEDAIRRDMADREFLGLCDTQSQATGKQRWTLSLAKVPQDLQSDQTMRHLMGDFVREVARESGQYRERAGGNPSEYYEYAETGQVYDEYREGYGGDVEYRYADFPLALGEAIMMNHALFAGLLHAGATPITDDLFHNRALSLKLRRASRDPAVQPARAERARQLKLDLVAATALMDSQLNLPVLSHELPLAEVLEYRRQHDGDLRQARNKLGWMARRIEAEPWTREFAEELEHKTIPDLANDLDEARKARDSWLGSNRGRLALSTTGIAVGAAAAVLSVFAAPLTPVALATAGLGLVSAGRRMAARLARREEEHSGKRIALLAERINKQTKRQVRRRTTMGTQGTNQSQEPRTFVVTGHVRFVDDIPAFRTMVVAFDRDLRREQPLGRRKRTGMVPSITTPMI
ncbi:hypothetical protein [Rhizobium sp. 007]|uniref:hypothetical protein n=1 Tax=Rhizobium sp. 007 TaxID=2785056 RepID=UPI00188F680C|nr:hypothetical protein [Rhizobium sp. 007]QPB24745.1 hypothetical protein ISN39_35360 [Rhizobium sp. 007]